VRRFLRENALSLFFLAIFLAALVGQALVGHTDFNHGQIAHGDPTMSLGRYVTSSAFWVDVMENWQSEYLQFTLYILATTGSSRSASTPCRVRRAGRAAAGGRRSTRTRC
jgi:fluoride ion exporter CrcB/FEX